MHPCKKPLWVQQFGWDGLLLLLLWVNSVLFLFNTSVVFVGSLVRPASPRRSGGERTGCHRCCVFKKLSPSCFSDYRQCKRGNRPSARKGLYTNCKVRTIHFPASPRSARCFNPIRLVVVFFSLRWVVVVYCCSNSLGFYLVAGVHQVETKNTNKRMERGTGKR